jgi:CRISPR-associated exonuclease Cas4
LCGGGAEPLPLDQLKLMFDESDLLPISGLQHLVFCERQWALIHLESAWAENRLTAEGDELHVKTDSGLSGTVGEMVVARSLDLRCLRLGVSGRADVVEFHGSDRVPFPVEYKHGKSKRIDCDRVQLCAQALCLEEMTGKAVPEGALFYATPRRREHVEFTTELRATTEAAVARMHELWREGRTPPPVKTPGCKSCSLLDLCQPDALECRNSASRYVRRLLAELDRET